MIAKPMKNYVKSILASLFILSPGVINASAFTVSYEISDSDINPGDYFSIDVLFEFSSTLELDSYAFDINPISAIFSKIAFVDVVLPVWSDFGFGFYDVDALAFPSQPGGVPLTVATLNFQALSPGLDTVELVGDDGFLAGAFFYDTVSQQSVYYELNESMKVSVPDSTSTASLALALLGVCAAAVRTRRKLV